MKRLKTIRVCVSLLFFLATLLLFLDFSNAYAPWASSLVLFLQFVPSLLKCLHGAVLGALGVAVVLLLTAFAGRIYCSSICPLGTLQDILGHFRVHRRYIPRKDSRPYRILRYILLALCILSLIAGINTALVFLDPFSSFGRIITTLVWPLAVVINNAFAMTLERFGVYALAREHWPVMTPVSVGAAVTVFFLILWFSIRHGRLYCNIICPVGALLGLLARFSCFRLKIDDHACTSCGRCQAVCKAGCLDLAARTVDMGRCVSCYNCLSVCRTNAIGFAGPGRKKRKTGEDKAEPGRRKLLLQSILYLLTFSGMSWSTEGKGEVKEKEPVQARPTTLPEARTTPISPPGSASAGRFTSTCTACHLCVSACPSQVLVPASFEYGLCGLLMPRMRFRTGHCDYECTICGNVCPTGAIVPLRVEEKKLTQVGVANFIKENCVVYTDYTACGACSEHCPTKAVDMVPFENPNTLSLAIPQVNQEICIGCGGCEHACPTRPFRAIFVDGNPEHKTAGKPLVEELKEKVEYEGDFPF